MTNPRIIEGSREAPHIEVPEGVRNSLPSPYDGEHLVSDLLGAFGEPPAKANRFRGLVKSWENRALYEKHRNPLVARDEAIGLYKFLRRFRRSAQRTELLKAAEGDAEKATQMLLANMNKGLEGGGAGLFSEKLERATEGEAAKEGEEEGEAGENAGKKKWGEAHAELEARKFRIRGLAKKLKLLYEPYSRRKKRLEEVPWPDEIEVEPLRSFSAGDLQKLVLSDQLQPDDSFFPHLAQKELRQVRYYEPAYEPAEFVMLLDVSGSMAASLDSHHSREEYAVASALALLDNALKGGNKCKFIRFDTLPFPPFEGTPAQIRKDLLTCQFSGGGTDIERAVGEADALNPDEIILITDGESSEGWERPKAPLTTYLVRDGDYGEFLRTNSRQFQQIGGRGWAGIEEEEEEEEEEWEEEDESEEEEEEEPEEEEEEEEESDED